MKLAAKLIIEDQYDRKFLTLKAEESKIEQFLWESQLREANNLDGETPVIDSIVSIKGSTKEELYEMSRVICGLNDRIVKQVCQK